MNIPEHVVKDIIWLAKGGTNVYDRRATFIVLSATGCINTWRWLQDTLQDYTSVIKHCLEQDKQ